jgi:hypothetical protein
MALFQALIVIFKLIFKPMLEIFQVCIDLAQALLVRLHQDIHFDLVFLGFVLHGLLDLCEVLPLFLEAASVAELLDLMGAGYDTLSVGSKLLLMLPDSFSSLLIMTLYPFLNGSEPLLYLLFLHLSALTLSSLP